MLGIPEFQKVSYNEALKLLRCVREAHPDHTQREVGFKAVYRRQLPFYDRYIHYVVDFGHETMWGFYASNDDVVLREKPGEERAEFIVSRRNPIRLTPSTAPAYAHLLWSMWASEYIIDPKNFTEHQDVSEVHRAIVREYARPPRFVRIDEQGVHWVHITAFQEGPVSGMWHNTLIEVSMGISTDGSIVEGEMRPVAQDLRIYRRTIR